MLSVVCTARTGPFRVLGFPSRRPLALHRLNGGLRLLEIREGLQDRSTDPLLGWPTMFVAVHFTRVFFRAPGFDHAWQICAAMLGMAQPSVLAPVRMYEIVGTCSLWCLVLAEPRIVDGFRRAGVAWWWRVPFPIRGTALRDICTVASDVRRPGRRSSSISI